MKEAMRCHPGVSYPLERIVPEGGTNLCGTHLEAGTIVGINPAVMHHDQSIFGEDAASFRPERWMESTEDQIKLMDRHLMTVSQQEVSVSVFVLLLMQSSLDMGLEHVLGRTSPSWKWENWYRN